MNSVTQPEVWKWASSWRIQVLFALLVFAIFSPGIDNFPAGDDFDWVFEAVKTLNNPAHFFAPINHFLRQTEMFYFCVVIFFFGVHTVAFFVASILLHVVNFVLVCRFITRICCNAGAGLAGALFWALNYKHVEVIYRQYGVADSLAVLFGISALLLLLEKRTLLATVVFVPALFSKENAVLLPVIAVIYLFMFDDRRSILRRMLPMTILTSAFVAAEIHIRESSSYLVFDWQGLSRFWDSLLTFAGPDVVTICQVSLGGKTTLTPVWLAGILSFLLVAVFFKASMVTRFALLWICITVAPTVFIVHQTSRYHYVPLVGVAILVAHGLQTLWTRGRLVRGCVAAGYVAVVFVGIAGIQAEENDHETIGEMHRQAAASLTNVIVPELLSDPNTLVLFVRGPTMPFAEDLVALNEKPWYVPMTYKWVYRRPHGVLGLASTYGFVTACSQGGDHARLFVAAGRDDFEKSIASGDFRIVVHDTATNNFGFATPDLRQRILDRIKKEDLYNYLQPGRFDSSFAGVSRLHHPHLVIQSESTRRGV